MDAPIEEVDNYSVDRSRPRAGSTQSNGRDRTTARAQPDQPPQNWRMARTASSTMPSSRECDSFYNVSLAASPATDLVTTQAARGRLSE